MKPLLAFVCASVLLAKIAKSETCWKYGEVYDECGSSCIPTCYNPNPTPCALMCVRGCFCAPGFVKAPYTDRCITQDQCEALKKNECLLPHEVFDKCSGNCERTCENKDKPFLSCALMCAPGCICQKGYVRDESSGWCVPPQWCPAISQTK